MKPKEYVEKAASSNPLAKYVMILGERITKLEKALKKKKK